MKRVMVTGNSGSGKSTVARALGEILGLPVIHLDRLYWKPNWGVSTEEEFTRAVDEAIAGERWVCDGNYGKTFDARFARADALVFLDLPVWRCVARVLLRHGDRPDLPPGCVERRFTRDFFEFIRYTIDFPNRRRPTIMRAIQESWDTKTIHHLRSQEAIDRFLENLRRASHSG